MPTITLPEPRRGLYAVGPLLFEDGVFEQDDRLTPVQRRLAEALYCKVEGDEGPTEDDGPVEYTGPLATGFQSVAGEDTPASPAAPEAEVAAAAEAPGAFTITDSSTDGSEAHDAPAAAPAAEPDQADAPAPVAEDEPADEPDVQTEH